ncbi:MAG: OmpA family protein [Flammeovirgaceae bacterium]|nr:OmpA family protein [Flammeovirgaceae bacterium]
MKSIKKALFILLIFTTNNLLIAQQFERQLLKGKKEFYQGNIKTAYNYFLEALYQDPNNIEAKYYAGICHLKSQSPIKALEYVEEVKKYAEDEFEGLPFYLATAYYQNLKFDKAAEILEQVSNSSELKQEKLRLEQLINHAKQFYKEKNHVIVKNMGPNVNTPNREYSTIISSNHKTILFTSKASNLIENQSTSEDENIFTTNIDDETLEWNKPQPIKNMNSKGNDATIQLFDNDKKMVTYHKGNLHISEFKNGKWQKGKGINGVNTPSYEAHCFIADNGNTIYFSSNYGTNDADLDLYFSTKNEDGIWSKPQSLNILNTLYDEDSPFLADDGTLYFSSKGHSSMGGFDIFKTRYDSLSETWEKPQNLGVPINSVFDDIFYVNYGKLAYFSSCRPGGFGDSDIYYSYLFDKVKMKGKLVEKHSQKPIPDGKILVKNGKKLVYETITDKHGEYEIIIPIEEEIEISIIKSDELLQKEKYIVKVSFKDVNNNTYDFELDVNNFGDEIPIANQKIYSNTKKIKLAAINDWEENDILVSDDLSPKIELSIGGEDTESFKEDLKPEISESQIRSLFQGKSVNLYFDHDNTIIKEQFYDKLDLIADYLFKKPEIVIEIGGHTDNQGVDSYNLKLSNQRAKAVALYFIEKGVSKDRIIAKGYGETSPIASNDDEDKGRELNRRVEIKKIGQNSMNLTTKK